MESGIIELAPTFKGSRETTAEEMKEYIQGVVTRFCEVTDLVVIETVDHEKGAFFVLGEEGKTQGIIAIGNNKSSSYYYYSMIVSNLGPNNEIRTGIDTSASFNVNDGQAYQFQASPVWMKYARAGHGIIIGLKQIQSPDEIEPTMVIQKIRDSNGGAEEVATLHLYNNGWNASYNPMLLNGKKGYPLFTQLGYNEIIIPKEKEAVADIYLNNGVEVAGMKLYTNKKNVDVWNKVRIGGTQYFVASKSNHAISGWYSLIMQVDGTA